MEFEGVVYKILPPVKGTSARGEWVKHEVIFELQSEFNRKLCVAFWGDKAQDVASLQEGVKVTVSINVESREYNGRWFTEARAWKIATAQGVSSSRPSETSPVRDMPPLDMNNMNDSAENDPSDDLPF